MVTMVIVDAGMAVDLEQLPMMTCAVVVVPPLTTTKHMLRRWVTLDEMVLGMHLIEEDEVEYGYH